MLLLPWLLARGVWPTTLFLTFLQGTFSSVVYEDHGVVLTLARIIKPVVTGQAPVTQE